MARLLRTAAFYVLAIGIGVIVVASTEVVSVSGVSGARDMALDVAARLRLYLAPFSAPSSGQPVAAPETSAAAPLPVEPFDAIRRSDAGTAPKAPVLSPACRRDGSGADGVVIGDRLRIRIFEQASLPAQTAPGGGPQAPDRLVFERLDVSGTYDVDQGGEVSLPMLGRLKLFGQTLVCAESMVVVRYFELTKTAALVNAAFDSRLPVTVAGAVRAPGSYAYSPGLTAGNLIARVGVPTDGGIDSLLRKSALLAQRDELLSLALGVEIERRRLDASLDRRATLDLTGDELRRADKLLGARRVESENAALVSELDALKLQDEQDAAAIADMTSRIAELETQDKMVGSQLDALYSRRDELKDFRKRGFILAAQLDSTIYNIMVSERFMQENQGKLLELRAAQRSAQLAGKLREADRRQKLTAQIRDLAEEADTLAGKLETSQTELRFFDPGQTGQGGSTGLALAVDRQGPDGVARFEANATTRLLPGDVLTASVGQTAGPEGVAYTVSDLGQMPSPQPLLPVSGPVNK